jgi:hypothetical protein
LILSLSSLSVTEGLSLSIPISWFFGSMFEISLIPEILVQSLNLFVFLSLFLISCFPGGFALFSLLFFFFFLSFN